MMRGSWRGRWKEGERDLAMGGLVLAGRGLPPRVVRHVMVGEASPETLPLVVGWRMHQKVARVCSAPEYRNSTLAWRSIHGLRVRHTLMSG
jgi:hypothetical protein